VLTRTLPVAGRAEADLDLRPLAVLHQPAERCPRRAEARHLCQCQPAVRNRLAGNTDSRLPATSLSKHPKLRLSAVLATRDRLAPLDRKERPARTERTERMERTDRMDATHSPFRHRLRSHALFALRDLSDRKGPPDRRDRPAPKAAPESRRRTECPASRECRGSLDRWEDPDERDRVERPDSPAASSRCLARKDLPDRLDLPENRDKRDSPDLMDSPLKVRPDLQEMLADPAEKDVPADLDHPDLLAKTERRAAAITVPSPALLRATLPRPESTEAATTTEEEEWATRFSPSLDGNVFGLLVFLLFPFPATTQKSSFFK